MSADKLSLPAGAEGQRAGLPKMFGRGIVAGVVSAIVIGGLSAAALLYHQAERDADREEAGVAGRVIRSLDGQNGALAAALSGTSAIVDANGSIEPHTFDTFARGAVATTLLPVLAYVQIVDGADRAAFESEAGFAITRPATDGLEPAATRDRYLPVRYVYPVTETSRKVLGFDILSEPIRAAAADAAVKAGGLVFSAPVRSQPSGQMSFFIIQPLFRTGVSVATEANRRVALVGYISALTPSATLLQALSEQLPATARIRITDDGTVLASTPDAPSGGRSVSLQQGGRTWVITVDYHVAQHRTSWIVGIVTLLLAAVVGVFLRRNFRQTGELRAAAVSVRELGRLSQRLATADTRDEMLRIIANHGVSTLGAAQVLVLGTEPADQDELCRAALATESAMFVGDRGAMREQVRGMEATWSANGLYSAASVPLWRPSGQALGVIEWSWAQANRFSAGTRSALIATAEVCQQSLYRSEVHDRRWQSASSLTMLSQRLSVARSLEQITHALVHLGPLASGADVVAVGFVGDAGNELQLYYPSGRDEQAPDRHDLSVDTNGRLMAVLKQGQPIQFDDRLDLDRFPALADLIPAGMRRLVCFPLIDSGAQLQGIVAFAFLEGSDPTIQPEAGRLATIADLAGQTVERSLLYQHEHQLVLNLQRQTLGDLPCISGLSIAARYLPASSTIGLGGDWYDVHELGDGRVGVVVGDVVGHGIAAIADMTQFRTTISTLLRTNPVLSEVPTLSTALLDAPGDPEVRFATAGLMVIDPAAHEMSYVRAGHPPALVRLPGGDIVVLDGAGSAPIGIPCAAADAVTLAIPVGSVIVAYTDGLIERREETIDDGLQRLIDALRLDDGRDVEAMVDSLVRQCLGDRQTNDDAAVLVVRVL